MVDPIIVVLLPIVLGMLVLGYVVNYGAAQYILTDEKSPKFIKILTLVVVIIPVGAALLALINFIYIMVATYIKYWYKQTFKV